MLHLGAESTFTTSGRKTGESAKEATVEMLHSGMESTSTSTTSRTTIGESAEQLEKVQTRATKMIWGY